MIISPFHPIHLTYCLNVHPGEKFRDQWDAIKTCASEVRTALQADKKPFGLGLRLGRQAMEDLMEPGLGGSFDNWCDDRDLYVITVNGFPYGTFHDTNVKADVYRPDWTDTERHLYTFDIAICLSLMLPIGLTGCISTVPLWYAPDYPDEPSRKEAVSKAIKNLRTIAGCLEMLSRRRKNDLCLALEPEPGCALETCDDVLAFFEKLLADVSKEDEAMIRRRIGVCVDTCHCALAFEKPADVINRLTPAGIRIPKIQLSAALSVPSMNQESIAALAPFAEPVYFHQTAQRRKGGVRRWSDLPEALKDLAHDNEAGETRVHFHVPLQWEGNGVLRSTRDTMDGEFWRLIQDGVCNCLEIETYTFNVLPKEMGLNDLAASIVEEYVWVMDNVQVWKKNENK